MSSIIKIEFADNGDNKITLQQPELINSKINTFIPEDINPHSFDGILKVGHIKASKRKEVLLNSFRKSFVQVLFQFAERAAYALSARESSWRICWERVEPTHYNPARMEGILRIEVQDAVMRCTRTVASTHVSVEGLISTKILAEEITEVILGVIKDIDDRGGGEWHEF